MSFETLVSAPIGYVNRYETVSSDYLADLKDQAKRASSRLADLAVMRDKLAERSREVDQAEKERDAARREVNDLKDLLKQTAKWAADYYKTPLVPGGKKFEMAFALGGQPDVKLAIKDSWGHKVVSVWRDGPKPDPDAPILAKLTGPYGGSAGYVLGVIRKAGLDITLKDQSKGTTTAVPPLKLVS